MTGATLAHDVPVDPQVTHSLDGYQGFSDKGLEDKLRRFRDAALPRETGGILLGYWDLNIGALVLVDALPASPDSVETTTSFIKGTDGLLEAVEEVHRRTAGVVGYVGEWHSHPAGVPAEPSPTDINQIIILASRMAEDGLPIASLIVGDSKMKLILGRQL